MCDGNGTPLLVLTSSANVPDISRALDLLDGSPSIAGRRGHPSRWASTLYPAATAASWSVHTAVHDRRWLSSFPHRITRQLSQGQHPRLEY
ncbi:hypothetical protein [Jidongwangia harbinensis]|uniref:hypothetical protein n=1 Tax=Jidongwangia harbinensis TaxID=2878561 RepID=UPI003558671E